MSLKTITKEREKKMRAWKELLWCIIMIVYIYNGGLESKSAIDFWVHWWEYFDRRILVFWVFFVLRLFFWYRFMCFRSLYHYLSFIQSFFQISCRSVICCRFSFYYCLSISFILPSFHCHFNFSGRLLRPSYFLTRCLMSHTKNKSN